jgi:hypothetical protein
LFWAVWFAQPSASEGFENVGTYDPQVDPGGRRELSQLVLEIARGAVGEHLRLVGDAARAEETGAVATAAEAEPNRIAAAAVRARTIRARTATPRRERFPRPLEAILCLSGYARKHREAPEGASQIG